MREKKRDMTHRGFAICICLAMSLSFAATAGDEATPTYFSKTDLTQREASEYFGNWPAGKLPAEIGRKVAENFLKRDHYQNFKTVVYPAVGENDPGRDYPASPILGR